MEKVKKSNLILAFFGLALSISCGILIKYKILSHFHISRNVALTVGGNARKAWDQQAYNYEFHTHVFSAENADGIHEGEKPILNDIGPFVFDLHQRRVEVIDHDEDDTVSYLMKRIFVFNSDKSKPLKTSTDYAFQNFLILMLTNFIVKSRPAILPLLSRSIDGIFKKPQNLYDNMTVLTHQFHGIEVNCTGVEEFFQKVICNEFRDCRYECHLVTPPGQEVYKASPWGWLNDTLEWVGRTRIKRGIENLADVAKVVQYNNANNFSKWDDEKCDAFNGTDGSAFSPYLTRNDTLHVVNTVLSRTFTYHYDSDVKHHNLLKTYRFTATIGTDLETNPDHKCYCAGACLKNGVFEAVKNLNWALVISNPHFYAADPYYNSRLIGMQPNKDKHLSYIDVDPLTGIVIEAAFRMQYNAQLAQHPKVRLMKKAYECLLPISWTDERFTLTKRQVEEIDKIHTIIGMEKIILSVLLAVGLIFFGLGFGNSVRELNKKTEK